MDRIGRYQIVKELGHGAMGIVYQAIDPNIGRPVAIKTLRLNAVDDPERRAKLRERLFREARSAGVLSHPGIVTIHDMNEEDGLAYIAMEFVDGPTLERLISSGDALPADQLFDILRQTAAALDFAHQKGIVHRDIKPGNLMLDEEGAVKITDFGIAKMDSPEDLTVTGTIVGTPNYMSPEQVQGIDIDGATDQFSLAVVAYEILTGERPFPGEQLTTVVYKIVAENPVSPHRINPTLGSEIDAVIEKGLAKKAADRYPSCGTFVGALEFACAATKGWLPLGRGGSLALPTMMTSAPAPLVAARKRWPGFLLIFSLFLLGLVGLWVLGRKYVAKTPAPPPPVERRSLEPRPSPMPPPPAHEVVTQAPARTTPQAEIPAPAPANALQDLWVTTNPPGASAILDGRQDSGCQTPCMLRVAPGRHAVTIALAGFQRERREITVGNDALDLPPIVLQKDGGTLMLSTIPPGATVFVDGRQLPQVTPTRIGLAPGSHRVVVESGGKRSSEQVEIQNGETKILKITM